MPPVGGDDSQMTHHPPSNFTLPKIDLSGNRNRFSEIVGCQGYDSTYDPAITVLAMVYFCFGALYTIFGYRCFKTTLFLTGFTFGTIMVYIICLQEYLMTKIGNISVSVCAGVLFGLITTLIQYVGLFVEGCHTGVMLGFAGLSIYDHLIVVFPNTFWQSAVTLICTGIFFAVITLYFKKGMTIFGTALYGGALIAITIDYFVEHMELLMWLWDRTKLMPVVPPPCRLTWLILAVWPAATIVGLTAQAFITGTKIYHEQSISAQKRRMKQQQSRPITREQRAELKQKKYRYLYQVRTAHGDVISQNYVQALQKKANGSNGNWNVGIGESSTLQSDSTHLTVLAGSDHHHDSDDDMHIRTAH